MPLFPSLAPYARMDSPNLFTAPQTFTDYIQFEGGFAAPSQLLTRLLSDIQVYDLPDKTGIISVDNVTAVAVSTVLSAAHSTIYATVGVAGITLTLPAASSGTIGRVYYAFKVDSGVGLLTIAPNGTNTLNGVNAAKTVANQFNGCRIQGLSATGWIVTSFTGL